MGFSAIFRTTEKNKTRILLLAEKWARPSVYCCWRKNEHGPQCTRMLLLAEKREWPSVYCCWRKNERDPQCTVVGGKTSMTLSVLLLAEKWARPSVSVCCKLPESYFSIFALYSFFPNYGKIIKPEYCCWWKNEHDPQCVVNYPKVIFPFFHCIWFFLTTEK